MIVYGDFEWSMRDAAANLAKHNITFKEAASVFADQAHVVSADDPGSLRVVGLSARNRQLVVEHVRGPRIRILSACPQRAEKGQSRSAPPPTPEAKVEAPPPAAEAAKVEEAARVEEAAKAAEAARAARNAKSTEAARAAKAAKAKVAQAEAAAKAEAEAEAAAEAERAEQAAILAAAPKSERRLRSVPARKPEPEPVIEPAPKSGRALRVVAAAKSEPPSRAGKTSRPVATPKSEPPPSDAAPNSARTPRLSWRAAARAALAKMSG